MGIIAYAAFLLLIATITWLAIASRSSIEPDLQPTPPPLLLPAPARRSGPSVLLIVLAALVLIAALAFLRTRTSKART